ncbi:DUF3147 family protein [Methylobacillus arboreus]|uniref:DUF3147 family protein n=1 Tax=Methylobacillus arboreus TaxID=755170 RepID=UPI001E41DC6D|nr:DUF3147 family protein [Methylobacillus arboreus]
MLYLIAKYLITAGIVVAVSEIAKRSDQLGAFIASLPLVTILTLVWLHVEGQPAEKISNHAFYTFWFVLPSLPLFLLFPFLYQRFNFWPALSISVGGAMLTVVAAALVLKKFGIDLF